MRVQIHISTDVYWGLLYLLSHFDHDQVKQYWETSQRLAQRDQFGSKFGSNSLDSRRDGTKLFSNNTAHSFIQEEISN